MKIKSTLFVFRRWLARVFHLGCETCSDGRVEMTWWFSVCPVCNRHFPSSVGKHIRAWHEYLPELNDIEWEKVKMELESGDYDRQQN